MKKSVLLTCILSSLYLVGCNSGSTTPNQNASVAAQSNGNLQDFYGNPAELDMIINGQGIGYKSAKVIATSYINQAHPDERINFDKPIEALKAVFVLRHIPDAQGDDQMGYSTADSSTTRLTAKISTTSYHKMEIFGDSSLIANVSFRNEWNLPNNRDKYVSAAHIVAFNGQSFDIQDTKSITQSGRPEKIFTKFDLHDHYMKLNCSLGSESGPNMCNVNNEIAYNDKYGNVAPHNDKEIEIYKTLENSTITDPAYFAAPMAFSYLGINVSGDSAIKFKDLAFVYNDHSDPNVKNKVSGVILTYVTKTGVTITQELQKNTNYSYNEETGALLTKENLDTLDKFKAELDYKKVKFNFQPGYMIESSAIVDYFYRPQYATKVTIKILNKDDSLFNTQFSEVSRILLPGGEYTIEPSAAKRIDIYNPIFMNNWATWETNRNINPLIMPNAEEFTSVILNGQKGSTKLETPPDIEDVKQSLRNQGRNEFADSISVENMGWATKYKTASTALYLPVKVNYDSYKTFAVWKRDGQMNGLPYGYSTPSSLPNNKLWSYDLNNNTYPSECVRVLGHCLNFEQFEGNRMGLDTLINR